MVYFPPHLSLQVVPLLKQKEKNMRDLPGHCAKHAREDVHMN